MSARPTVGSDRAAYVGRWRNQRIESGNERAAAGETAGKREMEKRETGVRKKVPCFEWQYNTAAKQWSTV